MRPRSAARACLEQLKTIQLERFFEDACVAGAAGAVEQVEQIDDGVAIVYPIISLIASILSCPPTNGPGVAVSRSAQD